MGCVARWPHLDRLCTLARDKRDMQVWIFGSALRSSKPKDIDVLLIYVSHADVVDIRNAGWWSDEEPPIDLIAMTPAEERDYNFISFTEAKRLV